jgi:hypothetical protein
MSKSGRWNNNDFQGAACVAFIIRPDVSRNDKIIGIDNFAIRVTGFGDMVEPLHSVPRSWVMGQRAYFIDNRIPVVPTFFVVPHLKDGNFLSAKLCMDFGETTWGPVDIGEAYAIGLIRDKVTAVFLLLQHVS